MSTINLSTLMSKQPVLNVGCVGHVAHGKSTVVFDLTGVRTQKHSSELERNITIQLGYANILIYRNKTTGVLTSSNVHSKDINLELIRHYSFVDCPGHQAYMATMVSGSETINVALMLIAASEDIPQAQTVSHANVLGHTDIENIAILFNKIDLLTDEKMVDKQLGQLDTFIRSKPKLQSKPIIPISAQKKINTNQILEFLASVPLPNIEEQMNRPFRMNILRSFNTNKMGVDIDDLMGGVVGGSIKSGHISINDWVIIKPGIISCHKNRWSCRPIVSRVISIQSDATPLETVYPGGLIALGLDCDPAITKNNNLLGNKIYKLDNVNFTEMVSCDDLAVDFSIEIDYLIPKTECASITEIYLLVNGSPIKGTVISREVNSNGIDVFRVIAEKPFAYDSTMLSILHKTALSIELFATGSNIVKHDSKMKIKLPSDIALLLDESYEYKLNGPSQYITVFDDVAADAVAADAIAADDVVVDAIVSDTIASENGTSSDLISTTFSEIKTSIMKHIKPKIAFKMTLPQPEFKVEPTRFDWLNAGRMIDKFNLEKNPELKCDINHSMIRWACFGNMIVKFFNYEYMSDEGLADLHDGRIILHIKRNTKNKPQGVISRFIKNHYMCPKCNSLSSRIGRIGTQYSSICVICDNRVLIHDDWIK
jgi:translation initiation factor 2 subunit 3